MTKQTETTGKTTPAILAIEVAALVLNEIAGEVLDQEGIDHPRGWCALRAASAHPEVFAAVKDTARREEVGNEGEVALVELSPGAADLLGFCTEIEAAGSALGEWMS